MAKVAFTAKRVAELECGANKSQAIHKDLTQPGLGLRVTAAGERAYIFEKKLNGRTIRMTIGDPRNWGLDAARTEAARLGVLVDGGKDPRAERRQQAVDDAALLDEAKRSSATLAEAWAVYCEARRPQWSERHHADHLTLAREGGEAFKRGKGETKDAPLWPLMGLKLTELTAQTVGDWLTKEAADRPGTTRRAFDLLAVFAGWCAERPQYSGLLDPKAFASRMRKDNLPKPGARHGCLQKGQLAAWFKAVRQIESPVMSSYLQILLLTGARREEMAALKWTDVNFQWGHIRLADKVEQETGRVIPMTPFVRSLLLELKHLNEQGPNIRQIREQFGGNKEAWKPSEYVFSSHSESGRLTSPGRALARACEVAGIEHLSPHDLRRSFGTLADWCELPTGVVAQIQGHAPSALAEKHYRRRPVDMLLVHASHYESWILEQAGIEFTTADDDQKATAPKLAAV